MEDERKGSGQKDVTYYLAELQNEVDSAVIYRTMSEIETQPNLAEVYRRLAETEEKESQFWEGKLRVVGLPVPPRRSSWRARALCWLARRFGPQFVLPATVAMEVKDRPKYRTRPAARSTSAPLTERFHARILRAIAGASRAGMEGSTLAQLEGRHRAVGGNALRAAVLGANDGLVSNLSLVMGVTGADLSGKAILITGLAGLIAGASSMAMGEWLSVQSSRELYQRQIEIEKIEIEEAPEEEKKELALIYQAKGLSGEDARALADGLMSDKAHALDTLLREELGIDPKELGGSPREAAITSFVLFALGAIIPVVPFAFLAGASAVIASLALGTLALILIGAAITLLTGRSVLYSGARQLLFGFAAAGLTYGIGRLIGVTLAG